MAKKNKKQALGRGLSALLDDPEREISSASDVNADKVVGNIIDLEIDKIEVNPYQPRTHFNEQAIEELAESIKTLGDYPTCDRKEIGEKSVSIGLGRTPLSGCKIFRF